MKTAISLFLGAALCAAALSGCSSSKSDLQTVRLCEVTHSIFYAPQYAAMELGYFEEEGIEIELSNGGGADKVMSAVLSDSMDIGLAGPEACIYVYNEGKEDYPQVFAQLTKRDGSMLVGRTEQPDFTWQSLKGSHILPGRKGGVPYMTGAFLGGTADYVTVFEPAASSIQAEGKGYIVAAVGDAVGDLPYTAYFAKSSYMEENPELIQGFANAVAKGEAWVKSHSAEEVAKLVAPHFADTDLELLTSAVENYQKVGAYCETPVMSEESFDRLQTVMESAGELSQRAAFDAVVNNTFAEKAASSH